MTNLRLAFAFFLLSSAHGCKKDDSQSPPAETGASENSGAPVLEQEAPETAARPDERIDGSLTAVVDGKKWATDGRVKSASFTPSDKRISQTLKGPVAGMESTMTSPKNLQFVIETGNQATGDFEFVRYDSNIKEGEQKAWIRLFASSGVEFAELQPKSGTMTIDEVRVSGDTPRVERLVGSFEGVFYGEGKDEHQVSGTFDFAR